MNWKRNQKYLPRPRHLYGLFFDNGCCYVGQTVDLKQREQQHRSARGGWQGRRFSFVPLSSMTGTQADAEAQAIAIAAAAALRAPTPAPVTVPTPHAALASP